MEIKATTLQIEIARVRVVLAGILTSGPGPHGVLTIKHALAGAEHAMRSGDVAEMANSYQELRNIE